MRRHSAFGALASLLLLTGAGCGGSERDAGVIEGPGRTAEAIEAVERGQEAGRAGVDGVAGGARSAPPRQILFGDLHVHTTFSLDAFFFSLPVVAGEGAHPPADACDYARHCSQLDFFALTDHAMGISREHWDATKESLRQCQARAGDPADPDIVALAGWEWTQVGTRPDDHWGHKNVIFPGLADEELPARPINSLTDEQAELAGSGGGGRRWAGVGTKVIGALDPLGWSEYADYGAYLEQLAEREVCERGVDTRELPPDCAENAPTPGVLFEKLAQWGHPVMVIPHGTTWGLYSPPGTELDKQLTRSEHDPKVQGVMEIMSGHGNSEEYRSFRAVEHEGGEAVCPEPSEGFMPCCWRAGEIMRERCGERSSEECEELVSLARQYTLEAGVNPQQVFPDTRGEDWLDCDQCRDCFKPSLGYRPKGSAQYALALGNFDEPDDAGDPMRFRFRFIASSDNHTARPGTGYKQYERRRMTESTGTRSAFYDRLFRWAQQRPLGEWEPGTPTEPPPPGPTIRGADTERVASFLYPGGLAAVHADGRSREAVWDALQRGEIYGTSGPRILLWFDLLNGSEGPVPMGSEAELASAPRFEVRAVGSFVQQEGCSEESTSALSEERLDYLCRGECYHPSDERHPIAAIEVVRIRPQIRPDEPIEDLIEDPWRRFECDPNRAEGCVVRFGDPEFDRIARDAVYYVRAIQEETPAVNGANLRTEFDAEGRPVSTEPCFGDFRTPFDEDCLAPVQERAWSSPIFVGHAGS